MPRTVLPAYALGSSADWEVLGTDAWTAVAQGSGDDSRLRSPTLRKKTTLVCGSGSCPAWGRVMAVTFYVRVRQTVRSAGGQVDVLLVRNGIEEFTVDTISCSSVWTDYSFRVRADPATGTRFTVAGVGSLALGIEVHVAPSSGYLEVSQAWIEVEYIDSGFFYDPFSGLSPDGMSGDLAWTKGGTQPATIVNDYLRIDDTSTSDNAFFFRTTGEVYTTDDAHVTEVETRQIVNTIPSTTGVIQLIAYFTTTGGIGGGREVAVAAFNISGSTYIGFTSPSTYDVNDPAAYVAYVALDLVGEDRHFLLRIDHRNAATAVDVGRVQVFVDYSTSPLLDVAYSDFAAPAGISIIFGSYDSDTAQVDIDYFAWKQYSRISRVVKHWPHFAQDPNTVVLDTTDADITGEVVLATPPNIPAQSRAALLLDVQDDTLLCQVQQYWPVLFSGWREVELHGAPNAHWGASMIYDSNREVAVLFGGATGATAPSSSVTAVQWEYSGAAWTQIFPAAVPAARMLHSMAYDSTRERIVLIGGSDDPVFFSVMTDANLTWEYDGTTWTSYSTTTKPTGRYSSGIAYDSNRKVVVLFGGYDGSSALVDTWEYDGSDWTQITTAHHPTGSAFGGMTYDSMRQKVVWFGGQDTGGTVYAETWEYDGSDWTQITTAHAPSAREEMPLTFSAATGLCYLFGGEDAVSPYFDDTWTYDGTDWTQQSPASSPVGKTWAAATLLEAQGQMVLAGGVHDYVNRYIDSDTWQLSCARPSATTYKLDLEYKTDDATNAQPKVLLQRCSDLYYWDQSGASWSSTEVSVTLAGSLARTSASAMTGITIDTQPDCFRLILAHDNLSSGHKVWVYRAFLSAQ